MTRVVLIVLFGVAVCLTAAAAMNPDYFFGPREEAPKAGVNKKPVVRGDAGSGSDGCHACPLPSN